jgi:hypothetical protein
MLGGEDEAVEARLFGCVKQLKQGLGARTKYCFGIEELNQGWGARTRMLDSPSELLA